MGKRKAKTAQHYRDVIESLTRRQQVLADAIQSNKQEAAAALLNGDAEASAELGATRRRMNSDMDALSDALAEARERLANVGSIGVRQPDRSPAEDAVVAGLAVAINTIHELRNFYVTAMTVPEHIRYGKTIADLETTLRKARGEQ